MWYGPLSSLKRQLKGNATLSAALMTAMIATVIFLTVFWLVAMLQDELKNAYQILISGLNQETYILPDFIKRIRGSATPFSNGWIG